MEQEAEGYWQSRAAGEPAGGSPGGAADVNQAGGEDKRPHVLQEGSRQQCPNLVYGMLRSTQKSGG